jgi:hypothetical protein
MRIARGVLVAAAATGLLGLSLAAPSAAGAPIKAGQHFDGRVNGRHHSAIVHAVCPGPSSTGHVAAQQTMSVEHVAKGHGYTGLFDHVYAWFQPASGGPAPTQLRFTHYASPRAIPTSIVVPCSGTGDVVFSSCPYLAPCAAGWVTDDVKVKFESSTA